MPRVPPHKSILIVRLSSSGDIVIASPIAERLKTHYPDSHIAWLAQTESAELLQGNSAIDEVIIWHKEHWLKLLLRGKLWRLLQEVHSLSRTLRSRHFDIALDLQGLLKSGFLAWLSGAKIRIGLGSNEGSERFMHKTISRNMGEQNFIGAEYRYLLHQIGVSDTPWRMHIPVSKNAEIEANALIEERIGSAAYMVICPFTRQRKKLWQDENWQQVVLRVRAKYRFRTVILGDLNSQAHGDKIASECGAINLIGKTTLQQSAAVIKHASLLIGVDTTPTHMGHALQTPTLALFGSSCPYFYSGTEISKVLCQQLPCDPCPKTARCSSPSGCIRRITPDEVLSEIKQLININQEQQQLKLCV